VAFLISEYSRRNARSARLDANAKFICASEVDRTDLDLLESKSHEIQYAKDARDEV